MPSVRVEYRDPGTNIDITITSDEMNPLHLPNAVGITLDAAIRSTVEPQPGTIEKPIRFETRNR